MPNTSSCVVAAMASRETISRWTRSSAASSGPSLDLTARPRPARMRSVRRISVLIALLCIGSEASRLLHLALASHERCAEHGELVHGQSEARPAPASPREDATLRPLAIVEGAHEGD